MRAELLALFDSAARDEGLGLSVHNYWSVAPTRFSPLCIDAVQRAAREDGLHARRHLQRRRPRCGASVATAPTAMIFIPRKDRRPSPSSHPAAWRAGRARDRTRDRPARGSERAQQNQPIQARAASTAAASSHPRSLAESVRSGSRRTAGGARGERQNRAFGQQLTHDPAARRAERKTDADLPHARGGPRQQQVPMLARASSSTSRSATNTTAPLIMTVIRSRAGVIDVSVTITERSLLSFAPTGVETAR